MKEVGILNQDLARIISQMGHTDEIIICDAGFLQPPGVEVIDLSLEENVPTVLDVLKVFKKYFSVETIVLSNETREVNPTRFKAITENFWQDAEIETIPHLAFRKRAGGVRAIVRTADFTAYSNVLLISGPGDRWYLEKQIATEA